MNFTSTIRCLFIALACLFLNQAIAADNSSNAKQYQVEIIIYSQITPQAVQSEQWPITPAFQLPSSRYVNLVQAADDTPITDNQIQLLPAKDFKLKHVQRRINNNPDYKTIMHIAFRTAAQSPRQAVPIHIQGGTSFLPNGDHANGTESTDGIQQQVNGMISLNVQRYFNVAFNLTFSAPLQQIASLSKDNYYNTLDSGLMHFHLLQNRRMRSNELNYIDFPLYGIVMKIFPIKQYG